MRFFFARPINPAVCPVKYCGQVCEALWYSEYVGGTKVKAVCCENCRVSTGDTSSVELRRAVDRVLAGIDVECCA